MKKYTFVFFSVFLLFAACKTSQQKNDFHRNESGDLVGLYGEPELKQAPYAAWFDKNYENYPVDTANLAAVKTHLKDVQVVVVMGTWCSDSRREVPRLIHILDTLDFPRSDVRIIGVDKAQFRSDKNGIDEIHDLGIVRVPTILFYKDKRELGRIIEYPVGTLESDMDAILTGKEYQPNYYEQWKGNE